MQSTSTSRPADDQLRDPRTRIVRAWLASCLAFTAACGGIRVVGGGGAWRCPQPLPEEIEFAAKGLGVKTVICLRDASPGEKWYEQEKAVCQRLGLGLHCLNWSARAVSQEKLDRLVELLNTEPGPYLFHCRAGRDRTSLAAAIYRVAVLGHSKDEASSELSFIPHGHVPWFGYGAMDEAFWAFDLNRLRELKTASGTSRSSGR